MSLRIRFNARDCTIFSEVLLYAGTFNLQVAICICRYLS
jgi:hypothetical protein